MSDYRELLIGCGYARDKRVCVDGQRQWRNLTTLDCNPACKPDIIANLTLAHLPFDDGEFDEIHAYEVLEHLGAQGDAETLFAQFTEYWRVLKPGGKLCATVPKFDSVWAWGDPSHTRVINHGTLLFLNQAESRRNRGRTPISDFSRIYRADYDATYAQYEGESFVFILSAVKPSRWVPWEAPDA